MDNTLQKNTDFFSYKWVELFGEDGWSTKEWSDREFVKWFGLEPHCFKDKIILDAGCGNGQMIKKILEFGAKAIVGVDISNSIEVAKRHLKDNPRIKLFNLDLNSLPAAGDYKDYFDVVFSSGVIHHTPDPRLSFSSLVSYARPGGLIAVWVYEKANPLREGVNFILRLMTKRLARRKLILFCRILLYLKKVPLIGKGLSAIIKIHNEMHGLIDWYGCQYQYHLSEREMKAWFKEEGVTINKVWPNPARLELKNNIILAISQFIYGKNLGWMGVIGKKDERDKEGRS